MSAARSGRVLTDIPGVAVGHWTDHAVRTGCTVVLPPEGTVASAEVRGGAPASRELDLLAPERTVERIDAVVLTGGSAFGLAAADGVVRYCFERGRGLPTASGVVPIVAALGLFDRAVGRPGHPTASDGYAACRAATGRPVEVGAVGAAAGATIGHWRGPDASRPGGLAGATLHSDRLTVSVLVAVNAFGDVDRDGTGTEGALAELAAGRAGFEPRRPMTHTTIGVVATNARLDKVGCLVVAQGAHDGLARAVVPVHTRMDGDAFVTLATGSVEASVDLVRFLALAVVERAVRAV